MRESERMEEISRMKVLKVCDVMCRVDVGDRYAVRLCVCVCTMYIYNLEHIVVTKTINNQM